MYPLLSWYMIIVKLPLLKENLFFKLNYFGYTITAQTITTLPHHEIVKSNICVRKTRVIVH